MPPRAIGFALRLMLPRYSAACRHDFDTLLIFMLSYYAAMMSPLLRYARLRAIYAPCR